MKLAQAVETLVTDKKSAEALTRVCLEFISAIRKNTSLPPEDLINDIVVEIEGEIGARISMLPEKLDDIVSKRMTASEMGKKGGSVSKGGGRPRKPESEWSPSYKKRMGIR